MPNIDNDEFMMYHNRVRPLYPMLFGIAHLITGNIDRAEYCIQCVIADIWYAGENNASANGLRELLRMRTIRTAIRSRNSEAEYDWNGLQLPETEVSGVYAQLRRESNDYQRILALHYACGFSARRCAKLCGVEVSRASSAISRFERRLRRKLEAADRRRFDRLMPRIFNDILSRPEEVAPDFSAVFRSFRADAEETVRPTRLPLKILRVIVTLVIILLCVVGFFLAAVLMQPATTVSHNPSAPVITESTQ